MVDCAVEAAVHIHAFKIVSGQLVSALKSLAASLQRISSFILAPLQLLYLFAFLPNYFLTLDFLCVIRYRLFFFKT